MFGMALAIAIGLPLGILVGPFQIGGELFPAARQRA
jgi:ABC-type nitrate/sulfonate/bicarbonate transport system permease component